jgi:2-amino-4-hydroxy-6-hydroxymethyldihydropteridine diphosphokinase
MARASGDRPAEKSDHIIYLGLGANLGDRLLQLQRAVNLLRERMAIYAVSSVYDTGPMLVTDQPRFLNLVCSARTSLSPEELLTLLKSIESRLGRVAGPRFGPRLLDIDLLLYDELVFASPSLTVPHPRMLERAFVLVPLAEIAPALKHPVSHIDMATLAEGVASADVRKLGPLFTTTS